MSTKSHPGFFPKLLTVLLAGALLLSACSPAATAINLPTSILMPTTESPTPIPATEVSATLSPNATSISTLPS